MGLNDFGAEKLAGRPLEFIFVIDVSGSMEGNKIESVNHAIRDVIPEMRRVSADNVNADIYVRALTFSSNVHWHIAQRTAVNQFSWSDISAGGLTSMGKALSELADTLDVSKMPPRGLPPVLVLLSDGAPTDDFKVGLKNLLDKPWGQKAVKIAIAIGDDADLEVLRKFINNPEIEPLVAQTASQLTTYIKWASTQVLSAASSSKSSNDHNPKGNVAIPPAPQTINDPAADIF